MTARDDIPAEVRAMKTSELVRAIALHDALGIMEIVRGLPVDSTGKSGARAAECAAELDARIPPREVQP